MSLDEKNKYRAANGDIYDSDGNVINSADYISCTSGGDGAVIIDDTSETTPDSGYVFYALQSLVNATVSAVTGNVENLAGKTLSEGTIIYGRFTSVTLSGGSVIAYNLKV